MVTYQKYVEFNNDKLPKKVKRIVICALILRLIMLLVIAVGDGFQQEGFLSSTIRADDWRYLRGAEIFSNNTSGLFDLSAFTKAYASLEDWVGYSIQSKGLFSATPLWYFISCFVTYVFKSSWIVRILTACLGAAAIIYIYKFTLYIYGRKTALLSSRLVAFLPYTVIFSCFAYKDHLMMTVMFYIFYKAAKFRRLKEIKPFEIVMVAVCAIVMMLLRSGFSVVILGVAFVIAADINFKRMNLKKTAYYGIIAAGVLAFVIAFWATIQFKLTHYTVDRRESIATNTISFLMISSVFDIYKLPFAYLFAAVSPVEPFCSTGTWYAVVANLNIIMCPISVGSLFYAIQKKRDWNVYLGTMILFVFTIVTSLNIFRHYYSLMPFLFIYFSEFQIKASGVKKIIAYSVSVAFALALVAFYGRKFL